MSIAARLDHASHPWPPYLFGVRPFGVAAMILGFILWWPVGLTLLAFLIWRRRMTCWTYDGGNRWQERMMERRARWEQKWAARSGLYARSSGNKAFDEYRAETLRRLEDEEKEFRDYLDRLRFAKDKAEFDQFLNERRPSPPADAQPQV